MSKIKKIIYNLSRMSLLKEMTNNLGKVEELDDKIICYVSKIKTEKKAPWYIHKLNLYGNKIMGEETMNLYNLNKPVHFIIKNISFHQPLCVSASKSTDITFENCEFHEDLCIKSAGNIILKNNKYENYHDLNYNCTNFLTVNAKKLKLQNENFINQIKGNKNTKFGIQVDSNIIEIQNSNIELLCNEQELSMHAKNLIVNDSNINCYNNIYINSDEINVNNSTVKSNTGITIKNKNNNEIIGINSPNTIYNDINVTKSIFITNGGCELIKSRYDLIDSLKKIRDYCLGVNMNKLEEISNNLDNKKVFMYIKKSKK